VFHNIQVFRKTFQDSKIADKYSCSRTKTSHIINSAIAVDSPSYCLHLQMNISFYILHIRNTLKPQLKNLKLVFGLLAKFCVCWSFDCYRKKENIMDRIWKWLQRPSTIHFNKIFFLKSSCNFYFTCNERGLLNTRHTRYVPSYVWVVYLIRLYN